MREFSEANLLQSSALYELIAVVNHTGTLSTGHYVALCKRSGRWVECNDAWVGGVSMRKLSRTDAYILFYKCLPGASRNLPFDVDLSLQITTAVAVPFEKHRGEKDSSQKRVRSVTSEEPPALNHLQKSHKDLQRSKRASQPSKRVLQHSKDAPQPPHQVPREQTSSTQTTSIRPVQEAAAIGTSQQLTSREASEEVTVCPTTHDMPLNYNRAESTESSCAEANNILVDVVLTEADVPGAALELDKITTYHVPQLRRWLKCRGLNQTGTADILRDRIMSHVRMGKGSKIDPKIDSGIWYEKKRALLQVNLEHTNRRLPLLPAGPNLWKEFPGYDIPRAFNSQKVDTYVKTLPAWKFSYTRGAEIAERRRSLVEPDETSGYYTDDDHFCPSDDGGDSDDWFTRLVSKDISKCLERGRRFLRSGRILRVWDTAKGRFYFLKAQVQASMQQEVYVVTSTIDQDSGKVLDATCTCKANALKRCAHIAGVLILVVDHVEAHGYDAVTCTGKPCYWVRRPEGKNPGIVNEKGHYYASMQMERRAKHDPRPTKYKTSQAVEKALLLKNSLSKNIPPRHWTLHLKEVQHEDPLDSGIIESVAVQCSKIMWKLNSCRLHHAVPFEIPGTREQRTSSTWRYERSVRCTASSSKCILGLTSPRAKTNFLRRHVWGLDRYVSPEMQYGIDHEPVAREAYTSWLITEHPTACLEEKGLIVNPRWLQFACSPDGIAVSAELGQVLLEIKCFSSPDSRNVDPAKFDSVFTNKKIRNFYLWRDEDGEIAMKKSHPYYFQIQMSLAILEIETCHFFVWSEVGYVTVTVHFDAAFWHERSLRLMTIHRQLLVPEHILKRTLKHLNPLEMTYPVFHESADDAYFSECT